MDQLFTRIRDIMIEHGNGTISRALASQQLLELLYALERDGADLPRSDKSRYVTLIIEHINQLDTRRNWWQRLFSPIQRKSPPLMLSRLDFRGLTLPDFTLQRAILIGCSFDQTNMPRARFLACQLEACSFRVADLQRADFRNSQLIGCSFEDANLTDVRGFM